MIIRRYKQALVTLLLVSIFSSLPGLAAAAIRIMYSEPLVILDEGETATGSRTIVFDAYGRRFNLQMEDNLQLNRQRSKTNYRLLRGTVIGQNSSWVRLMVRNGEISGMFYDGQDTYAIEAGEAVAGALINPEPAKKPHSIIYRLQDTLMETGQAFCSVRKDAGKMINGKTAFAQLKAEMNRAQPSRAQDSLQRLLLGVVADFEFSSEFGSLAESEILARINIVDGIFSAQAGVEIFVNSDDIVIFTNSNDPFLATESDALLDEVSTYRQANQSHLGLTHLLTHRELLDTTVGVAWMDSLCDPQFGASLSQTLGAVSQMESALIMAHEIGHNFGADHDGEAGSSCENATEGGPFLMNPSVTTSSTFSQCSLDDMAVVVAQAASLGCIISVAASDIALSSVPTQLTGSVGEEVLLRFNVRNNGSSPATGVVVTITVDPSLEIVRTTVDIGSCTSSGNTVNCQLDSVEQSGNRMIRVTLRSATAGSLLPIDIVVSADADHISANNSQSLTLTVNAAQSQAAQAASGGGGGAADMVLILSLIGALALRRRRQPLQTATVLRFR